MDHLEHQAITAIIDDTELARDVVETATADGLEKAREFNISATTIERALDPKDDEVQFHNRPITEAIVVEFGRPALLVRNDTFELPPSSVWRSRLLPSRSRIEAALRSVGRVEVSNHPDFEWIGTGWMVAENVLITNRHVAAEFAEKGPGGFLFSRGPLGPIAANVDFKEEHNVDAVRECSVEKIVWLEERDGPDLALVRIKGGPLPAPIPLQTKKPDNFIAAIGYPAFDSRNGERAMLRIFGNIFDVKRFSPGQVKQLNAQPGILTHDCSTLGGNSGSAIIDIATGHAIALHFGGRFRQANFAVKAEVIEKRLADLTIAVRVPGRAESVGEIVERPTVNAYADRRGYEENFLGIPVPLPTPKPALAKQIAATQKTRRPGVLDYMHFSVVLHKSRKLAVYAVVNIDGRELRRVPSRNNWILDPRVAESDQTGPAVYADNDLDRGHQVRRLDPVWGNDADAKKANADTFHFTNACPQVHRFNAGSWNQLEDYLLDAADAENLKMSVFTGPVLAKSDKKYRNVQLPAVFWKVAVIVRGAGANRKLSAAGFRLSQSQLLGPFEEFRLGQGRTEQVRIAEIEKLTSLSFGLTAADTFGLAESAPEQQEIRSASDIVI